MMSNPRFLIIITVLFLLSLLHRGIVNGKTCIQPDFRIFCGYCEGKPTVKETAACVQECSETKWKAANEEYDQCIRDGGTPGLSDDMQKEIQKVLPGFKLPIVPDIKLPVKEPSLRELPKETNHYTPAKELVVQNLAYGKDVREGDTITGAKGTKTVIHMPGGSIIDIREGGQIKFKSENSLETTKGFFKFLFIKLTEKSRTFTIKTSTAITSVRGTEFLIESDESKTFFTVLKGKIEVSDLGAKKTVEVSGGYQVVVERGKLPSDPEPFDPKSIDRWYEVLSQVPSEPHNGDKFYYLLFAIPLVILIPLVIRLLQNLLKK